MFYVNQTHITKLNYIAHFEIAKKIIITKKNHQVPWK
jgi:hypothetical protein